MIMSVASWIVLLVLSLIIFSSILALAIGFYRGLVKTSIKAVIKLLFVILWIFVTPVIAKNIVNINLANLGIPSFTLNGKEIVTTNLSETVSNIITALGFISPINGLSIYGFIISIAELIICYALFFTLMLVSNLVVDIVSSLVYNGLFRWFYQIETFRENLDRLRYEKSYKDNSKALSKLAKGLLNSDGSIYNRKEKHPLLKIGGAVLGFFVQVAFALVICSPLTALFRIADKNKDSIFLFAKNLVPSQSERIDQADEFIETIASSPLSKIYTLPNGLYLDSLIMNKVSSQEIYGYNINLDSLISSITDVSKPIMTSDSITYQEGLSYVTYNFSTLLSVSTIDSIISSILLPQNSSFYALIPPLIDIGLAMISANTSFSLDTLNLNNIDWSKDLEAINSIYELVYSSAIDSIVDNDNLSPHNFYMSTSKYTDSQIDAFSNAAKIVGSTNLIQSNAGNIINTLRTILSANGYDLFPSDESTYDEIDWSNEFYILARSFFRLLRLIDIDIQANMNFTLVQENLINSFKDKEKREEMKDILISENGLLDLKLFSLLKKGDTVLTMLDTFLSNNVSGIDRYIENERFVESVRTFNSRGTEDIKLEVSYMFSIINILAEETNAIHWDDDFNFITREEFDDDSAREIYDLLQIARHSVIFSSLYPIILEAYLTNNFTSSDVKDFLFGLTPYNFNYDDEEFVDDFSRVILVMPSIINLYQKINGNYSKEERIDALDVDSIKVFLSVIANSDFFNPNNRYISNSDDVKNSNMEVVLNTLFSADIFKSLELEVPSREKISNANWGSGNTYSATLPSGRVLELPSDEIANICLMLKSIKENKDYFALDLDELHLADLDKVNDFNSIFDLSSSLINSDLFKESGISAIVNKIERYFNKKNVIFSFNDLRNYAYEEEHKYKLLDDLYSLKLLSPLFNKINYTNLAVNSIPYIRTLESDELNVFFTTIAKTNYYLDNTQKDVLANFIYLAFKKFDIFGKYNLPDYSSSIFSAREYNSSWINTTEEKSFVIDEVEYKFNYTSSGSIRNICSIFDALKSTFYISKLKEEDYSTLDFRQYLLSELELENSSGNSIFSDMFIRKLLYIYSGSILNLLSENISYLPKEFFNSYIYINPDYIYGENKVSASEYGQSLYDLDEFLLISLTKIGDNEVVFNRLYNLNNIFSINELGDEFNLRLKENIESISNRVLFTTKKESSHISPVGNYFYNLFKANSSLTKYFVLGGDNNSDNLLKIKSLIENVDKNNSWQEEISNYANIIYVGNNISYNPSEYNISSYSAINLKEIYDSLNNSTLLHQYMVHRIKTFVNKFNINNYLINSSNNILHPLDFNSHLTTSSSDITYYSHDYNLIFDIMDGYLEEYNISSLISNNNLGSISSNPAMIYLVSSLNIFKDNYHYIIANMLKNEHLDKYINEPNKKYYLEDNIAIRIKEILSSSDLIKDSNIETEINLISSVLNKISVFTNLEINSASDIKNAISSNYFNQLLSSTYNGDYRSNIASELVAGLLNYLFNINTEINEYFLPYSNYNFFNDENQDYYYITSEVGLALDEIINQ